MWVAVGLLDFQPPRLDLRQVENVIDQIQQVLAACKEFNVACGYPANENDIEMRMQQGFSVFVMSWGEAGFRTVELGKKLAGR